MIVALCQVCLLPLAVGEWPCIRTVRPHAPVYPRGGFEPRFDVGLGEHVAGWGDIKQHMRRKHLDFRDHPSKGDMSALRDRTEKRKQARATHST